MRRLYEQPFPLLSAGSFSSAQVLAVPRPVSFFVILSYVGPSRADGETPGATGWSNGVPCVKHRGFSGVALVLRATTQPGSSSSHPPPPPRASSEVYPREMLCR